MYENICMKLTKIYLKINNNNKIKYRNHKSSNKIYNNNKILNKKEIRNNPQAINLKPKEINNNNCNRISNKCRENLMLLHNYNSSSNHPIHQHKKTFLKFKLILHLTKKIEMYLFIKIV